MFSVFCARHGATVLLGSADVIAVTNSPAGPQLHWECFCGQTGLLSDGQSLATEGRLTDPLDRLDDEQQGPASPARLRH